MQKIDDKSIDCIICDLPYGTTACKWDVIIPFDLLWKQYERIAKDNAPIILFGSQPFSSLLVTSNLKLFKYEWIWKKERPSNPLMANKQVLKYHESILVFYKNQCLFKPELRLRNPKNKRKNKPRKFFSAVTYSVPNSEGMNQTGENDYIKPMSVIDFSMQRGLHPTQKPVPLFEYLIKTYTNPSDLILDNCAGSFTTAIAAQNTNRNYICIEKEEKYFNAGLQRILENTIRLDNIKQKEELNFKLV